VVETQGDLVRQLQAERARLVAAQAVAKVGSWETDLSTLAVTWSDETFRIFEAARGEPLTHERFLGFVHPGDRAAVSEAFERSAGRKDAQRIEHRLLMPDGRIKWVEERWQAFFDAGGRPQRAIGTCQDISTQRLAEEAIRLQARMLDSIGQAVIATDVDGRITYANLFAEQLYGWPKGDMLGRSIADVNVPEAGLVAATEIMEILRQGRSWSGEFTVRRRDGTSFPACVVNSPILDASGKLVGIIGISSDVSEKKAAAQALTVSVDEFRTLAEAIPQIVWIACRNGSNTYCNPQWTEYTGLSLADSLGQGWRGPFHPDDEARTSAAWANAVATGGIHVVECRLRRADGVYRWWLIRTVPRKDAAGNVVKWFGTATDIHDLKVAQLELSQSRERFAHVFNSSLVAIGIKETESGVLVETNASFAEFFGYTRAEMIGRTTVELGLWNDPLERARLVGGGAFGAHSEVALRRKSGEIRHALVSVETMGDSGGPRPLSIMFLLDMTQRRLLETQLLQSQKMEAVGRLAGGVAHDFNNSLGVILGYTEILMRQANEGQRGRLQQILKATQRATGLTRQLLAFSRKQVIDPTVLDLNSLLADLEPMLGPLLGEDVDIAIVSGEELGQVKADRGQLEQVLMNLCVNARDAMPDGGMLRIETANVVLDAAHAARLESVTPGRYVCLSVTDAGCGIPQETLAQIFEPFFTTKPEGKGTGLGLAMVYGTVKQAGGHVSVYSEVGHGTTFRVYLPRIDEPVTAGEIDSAPLPQRGMETILVVEDEEALRAITHEILADNGYEVLTASGGEEAIAIAAGHRGPIHLVVTDVVMPGMNGRALAGALVASRPGLGVLYMSGYTDDVIAHRGVLETGTMLLGKPFTVLALLRTVRAALVARSPKGDA
jgi:PAS domain S-box-containing protein